MPSSDRPRTRSVTPDGLEPTRPVAMGGDPHSPPARPARIVIADDDRLARELLAGILRGAGHTVEAVEDGQAAVERVGQGGVDLVLLDVVMPRLSGVEACRLLKGMTLDSFLPVLLVTVKADTQSRVEGLRIGADDYVCKPFDEAELVARVASMLRIKRLHEQVTVPEGQIREAQRARRAHRALQFPLPAHAAQRGVQARRALPRALRLPPRRHRPAPRRQRRGRAPAGDAVIRKVAEGIKRCVREVDVVARYGGEEFLVVLPSTHFAGSVVVAERIWRETSGRAVDVERRPAGEPVAPPRRRDDGGRVSMTDLRWAEGPRAHHGLDRGRALPLARRAQQGRAHPRGGGGAGAGEARGRRPHLRLPAVGLHLLPHRRRRAARAGRAHLGRERPPLVPERARFFASPARDGLVAARSRLGGAAPGLMTVSCRGRRPCLHWARKWRRALGASRRPRCPPRTRGTPRRRPRTSSSSTASRPSGGRWRAR